LTAASPIDAEVNPNNTDQRYVLWGNGRIDAVGGAVPITGQANWYDSINQPIAVAFHITDWSTGAGYMLDLYGGTHTLNGAPAIGTNGVLSGVPYTSPTRRYVDWSWDPAGSGRVVVLDQFGQLYNAAGANAAPRVGARFTWPAARKLAVNWNNGQPAGAITQDLYGGLHGDYGLSSALAPGGYWPGFDAARDLVVTSWTTSPPSGYTLDLYGGVHEFGTASQVSGGPSRVGADVARLLVVLSASNPLRLWEVWSRGEKWEWVVSTPPTVVAGGDASSPPSTVTTTTRPTLAWTYSDPEKDSQAAWDLYVFDQTFVTGHSMTDPSVWASSALAHLTGTDRARRGAVADYDFANGSYRMYVRAQDTSGKWSAWSNLGWTQNVAAPAKPTGLTATANQAAFTVALSASCTTGGTASLVRFDCSDDGGVTWVPVRGAEAVPLKATTTATDYDPPLGVTRTYRATSYSNSPRVVSVASSTAMAKIAAVSTGYALTSTTDPTLGGVVFVTDAPSWTRNSPAGVFEGVGAEFPTVVDDGSVKAQRETMHILTETAADWNMIQALVTSKSVLVYRSPFGEVVYCKVVGDWGRTHVSPVDFMHTTDLPLVQVAQPTVLAVASTVPPGPAGS